MQSFPDTPDLTDATDVSGHVWIQEWPTGGPLRFQVANSGLLTFGPRDGPVGSTVPLPWRSAARSVRERLDREAFQDAVADPDGVTFFGVATRYAGVDYDWTALPPFVGSDVWTDRSDRYLPPDEATRAFRRLGLPALPAVEKERPRAHADLGRYADPEGFPPSRWYDGPAAAVTVRDKTGGRGLAWNPALDGTGPDPNASTAEYVATEYVTETDVERAIEACQHAGESPTVDAVRDRAVEWLVRTNYARLYRDGEPVVPMGAVASAVAERVQRHLHGGG